MKRIHLLSAAIILGLLSANGRSQDKFFKAELTAKDIETTLGADWYGVYLQNKKIGNCKIERARAGDTIAESFAMNMKLVVFNKKADMKIKRNFTFENKPPYRLLDASLEQDDGTLTTKITAKRNDKGFAYTVTAGGKERTKEAAAPEFDLNDNFSQEMWLRAPRNVGDTALLRDLDLEDWKLDPNNNKIKSIKKSLVGGVEVTFYEVQTENRKSGITFLSRFDNTGKMLSGNMGPFELRKETEEQAKNLEFSQDLFVLGTAKLDKAIGHTTRLTELVLKIDGDDKDILKDGPRQTVAGKELRIGKKHANAIKPDAKEIDESLAETKAYVISDAQIKKMAAQAVGDAKAPAEKVKKIVAYVHDFITPTMSVSLPNIHDLLEKKKGDCKSYALLTTTLCRAAGVPSREVAGLVYMGDDAKAFAPHAWNEVLLDGIWVPVDATLNQTDLDAGHISFGENRLAVGALLNSLGKLSFRVVDVKTNK